MARLFFAAGLLSLSALLPATALASGQVIEYVAGAEYALGTCSGGSTGSFAGYGSLTAGGAPNAVFNTTICHSAFSAARTAAILPGGSFTLVMTSVTLVGRYTDGIVGPGVVHGNYFCTETFPVTAGLGLGNGPGEALIRRGSAVGHLTHYGVRNGAACNAYAATITGVATLNY
jgi:hypothetical protein